MQVGVRGYVLVHLPGVSEAQLAQSASLWLHVQDQGASDFRAAKGRSVIRYDTSNDVRRAYECTVQGDTVAPDRCIASLFVTGHIVLNRKDSAKTHTHRTNIENGRCPPLTPRASPGWPFL